LIEGKLNEDIIDWEEARLDFPVSEINAEIIESSMSDPRRFTIRIRGKPVVREVEKVQVNVRKQSDWWGHPYWPDRTAITSLLLAPKSKSSPLMKAVPELQLIEYLIILICFCFVLGIGFILRWFWTLFSGEAMGIDLRYPIGFLFLVCGILLLLFGLFSSPADHGRSLNLNVNLWWGLVMLIFGATIFFFAYRKKPARHQSSQRKLSDPVPKGP
jgi:hypothetical protein